jgi:hypothetical protein
MELKIAKVRRTEVAHQVPLQSFKQQNRIRERTEGDLNSPLRNEPCSIANLIKNYEHEKLWADEEEHRLRSTLCYPEHISVSYSDRIGFGLVIHHSSEAKCSRPLCVLCVNRTYKYLTHSYSLLLVPCSSKTYSYEYHTISAFLCP